MFVPLKLFRLLLGIHISIFAGLGSARTQDSTAGRHKDVANERDAVEAEMVNEVVLVTSDSLGGEDRDLGKLLMGNFVRLMANREDLPAYIVLWNGGVLLASDDSGSLEYLKKMEERGVVVISCVTCVEYFGLQERIGVGSIDTMVAILDILAKHNVLTV